MVSMRSASLRRRSAVALSFAASLLFAACGSDDSTTEGTEALDATTAQDSVVPDPSTTDTEVESEAAESATEYLGTYTLTDEEFGTMTSVTVDGDTRTINSNAIPDHETGEFPNDGNPNAISEQDASYVYPTEGVYVGSATGAMTPGVAVNGVKFEPGTAETVTCVSGETLRVEALQDIYDLGLDFNNAHVQPTGEFHYHGLSELLVAAYATDDDLVHVGFAADGFLIYSSKSGAYSSGYSLSTDARSGTDCRGSGALQNVAVEIDGSAPDGTYGSDWVFSDNTGDLDECNGVEIDGEYAYIITNEYPYVSRCLNGEFTATGSAGAQVPGATSVAEG